jgi:alpha-glucosidase (family GH31 glycosyl hydrolase)
LVRWTAHCAFGTIHRFHGAAHQPWSYESIDNTTEDIIRSYLKMRYKLMPSFIAAGHQASITGGFPLVARCDLYWPQFPEASSNHQYIHLNETLVAPGYYVGAHGYEGGRGALNQSVWIPPGEWKNVWSGETATGPRTLNVTSIPSQMPMWHRAGGLLILASQSMLRVDEQDWSRLILEAHLPTLEYCARGRQKLTKTTRTVFQRESGAKTEITMTMRAGVATGTLMVGLQIGQAEDGASRAWTIRLHLPPLASVVSAMTDGSPTQDFTTLEPVGSENSWGFLPFGGIGTQPAPLSGLVTEMELPASHFARSAELLIGHT